MLGTIADPRKPRGLRHQIGAVLAVTVFAVLAGARNFREADDRAAGLPQELLALAGCRQDPVTGRCVAPSEPTSRRMAHDIDADAADRQVCRWMREQAAAAALAHTSYAADRGLIGVAMDGKTVGNTVAPGGPEGSEVKLFSAMLHRRSHRDRQLRVPDGTNEITQVAALLDDIDLTGVVITGDAAHAQHATAAHLTCERGGDYALTVKGNQPTVRAQIAAALPPPFPEPNTTSMTTTATAGSCAARSGSVPPMASTFPVPHKSSGSAATPSTTRATTSAKRSCTASPASPPNRPDPRSSRTSSANKGA